VKAKIGRCRDGDGIRARERDRLAQSGDQSPTSVGDGRFEDFERLAVRLREAHPVVAPHGDPRLARPVRRDVAGDEPRIVRADASAVHERAAIKGTHGQVDERVRTAAETDHGRAVGRVAAADVERRGHARRAALEAALGVRAAVRRLVRVAAVARPPLVEVGRGRVEEFAEVRHGLAVPAAPRHRRDLADGERREDDGDGDHEQQLDGRETP
jgi:hypothetical protein